MRRSALADFSFFAHFFFLQPGGCGPRPCWPRRSLFAPFRSALVQCGKWLQTAMRRLRHFSAAPSLSQQNSLFDCLIQACGVYDIHTSTNYRSYANSRLWLTNSASSELVQHMGLSSSRRARHPPTLGSSLGSYKLRLPIQELKISTFEWRAFPQWEIAILRPQAPPSPPHQ